MLLTRAPLDHSCITTQVIPCDLHVLNTPPAFVLSQNQTLRKNDLMSLDAIAGTRSSNRGCRPRGPASAHCFNIEIRCAAHNLIFFLFPAISTCLGRFVSICVELGTIAAGPYCQRACFEGTKKPIGWFSPRLTVCLSVALRRGDGRNLFRPADAGQSIL